MQPQNISQIRLHVIPSLSKPPLCPGPGSVWEAECWSRTQEPAEGCSSERRSGCRLRAAPVTCWPYTGQDALYTINTDTVPYPLHHTPAAVMLSQPSTLLHIHIHSHCTALAAVRSSRKTLGNYLLQFLTLHML